MFVNIKSVEQQDPTLLGKKGFGLWQMTQAGLAVPPAIVIPTSVCRAYFQDPFKTMQDIAVALPKMMVALSTPHQQFPLVSVRSSGFHSAPGMMDTILNVGLTAANRAHWVKTLGKKCAIDCESRLATMYTSVVGIAVPDDITAQLLGAIKAVFDSWNNDRAVTHRNLNNIPHEGGTAIVIQHMVYGNRDKDSGTAVVFTRNPDSGENEILGEWLANAQGEDIVAGTVTPQPLTSMEAWNPDVLQQVVDVVTQVEQYYKDCYEIELTIDTGKVWVLQVKHAQRTPRAAVRLAMDFYQEGVLTLDDVFKRISPRDYYLAQQATIDSAYNVQPDLVGLPVCSGVAIGKPIFSRQDAIDCDSPFIFIAQDTNPEDIAAMHKAMGVVTMTGGVTCHAAVVCRGMNKPCIVGVGANLTDFVSLQVSMDGETGRVWFHTAPVQAAGTDVVRGLDAILYKHAGVSPIDYVCDAPSVFLDVSRDLHDAPAAVAKVVAAHDGKREVIVKIGTDGWTPEEVDFYRQIGVLDQHEQLTNRFVIELVAALPDTHTVRLLSEKPGTFIPTIQSANTLDQLIAAEDEVFLKEFKSPSLAWVLKKKAEDKLVIRSLDKEFRSRAQLVGEVLTGAL